MPELPAIPEGARWLVLAALCASGLFLCFFGYRLFRAALALLGFLVLGGLGLVIATALTDDPTWVLGAGVLGGIAGAIGAGMFYEAGVFSLGASAGGLVGASVAPLLNQYAWAFLLIPVCSLLCGILAVHLQKTMIAGLTAAVGAWLLCLGALCLFQRADPIELMRHQWLRTPQTGLAFGVMVALAFGGLFIQLRGKPSKHED